MSDNPTLRFLGVEATEKEGEPSKSLEESWARKE